MIPIIVLIGRTNVGKSTLFNVLTKTRNALVADHPGLTRDRQYGFCQIQEENIVLIDTAGLDLKSTEIEQKAYEQTLVAIKESHLILFLVDARSGLIPQEFEIINNIRNYEKKSILIINKIDGINDDISRINDFYSLGIKKITKISATHKQGINTLISKFLIPWIKSDFKRENVIKKLPEKNINIKKSAIKVSFIGRPNAGKSTLINNLLKEERMITCNIPGTTLDSISTPIKYKDQDYILIDTAGAPKKNKKINNFKIFSIIKTLQSIEKSDICILIIDANVEICNQDLSLADFIIDSGKGIVIIINKWDLLNSLEKKKMREAIKKKLKFLFYSRIHFVSALYKKGIFQIFQSIKEANRESEKKISTSTLIKTMHMAIKKHQPPIIQGRRIKLKYAHLGSSKPPKIIIHGNQVKHLPSPYKRYLVNFFHTALNLKGTPIKIKFKDNINPYIKNKKINPQ